MTTNLQALYPEPSTIADPDEAIWNEPRSAHSKRPWLYTNMITSADGAISVGDTSGGLGGPADRRVFKALRAACDVILVGASTVRIERYRPPIIDDELRSQRQDRGQQGRPEIAIVTNSLGLDLSLPIFTDDSYRPLVLTSEKSTADKDQLSHLKQRADVVVSGPDLVDFATALEILGTRGYERALCEGGPSINGQLIAADLIDEWNLSLSPMLVGGSSPRSATDRTDGGPPDSMRLSRVWLGDDFLFCRWTRDGSSNERK